MATSRRNIGSMVSVNSVTELVSSTSIDFMRPIQILVNCSILKPNTKFNCFFDGENVNQYCTPSTLVTDANGELEFTFQVPANKFRTGTRQFFLTERNKVQTALGDVYCRAEATFSSAGILQKFQTTTTTTTTNTVEEVTRREVIVQVPSPEPPAQTVFVESPPEAPPAQNWVNPAVIALATGPRGDPLAQSFFTFGIQDGCFITGIDLFFESKDEEAPIWVEIRKIANGVPSTEQVSSEAIAVVNAADVNVSNNGSVPTRFTFNKMIRLLPDGDYCFVVQTRSTNYNLWCSRMSDFSNETGRVIFQQPYVGSLFKSENNLTWNAEQYEDIKFTLYHAKFNTNVEASINLQMNPGFDVIDGTRFNTFSGSSLVLVHLPQRHGLDIGSFVSIKCDERGTYNGVSGSLINGDHEVVAVRGEKVFAVSIPGGVFDKTGPVEYNGIIREIQVDAGGVGYTTSSPPTVLINGVDKSSSVTLTIADGAIKSVDVGNGIVDPSYLTGPVTISFSGVGTGAAAFAFNNAKFGVRTNRVYHTFAPSFALATPNNTQVYATLKTTLADFEDGTVQNYFPGKTYPVSMTDETDLDNSLLLASRINEVEKMAGGDSAVLNLTLRSSSQNVSPVIDINKSVFSFYGNNTNFYAKGRNSQVMENVDDTSPYGSVTEVTILNGGSGYSTAPTVKIVGQGAEEAVATATIVAGAVTAVSITSGGKYTEIPEVIFEGTSTVPATAVATLSEFNSELLPYDGYASSRYITKKQKLSLTSNGIRILFTAYSNVDSAVDFYIKTSLSTESTPHDDRQWVLVDPSVDANKSVKKNQFIEYELNLTDMEPFDVFNLKIVLRSKTPWDPPIVSDYRAILLAA